MAFGVQTSSDVLYAKTFTPLYNDEETLTAFLHDLGASKDLRFDIPELSDLSQTRVLGAIVTLKDSGTYESDRDRSEAQVKVPWPDRTDNTARSIKFVPQTIDNACGLFLMLHLVLSIDNTHYGDGSILKELSQSKDPGAYCVNSSELQRLNEMHANVSDGDESDDLADPPAHHIAVLLKGNGDIWELDGDRRRRGPVQIEVSKPSLLNGPRQ